MARPENVPFPPTTVFTGTKGEISVPARKGNSYDNNSKERFVIKSEEGSRILLRFKVSEIPAFLIERNINCANLSPRKRRRGKRNRLVGFLIC